MKIRDISIDGFGVWSGLQLLALDDHINVFYGPNEAGKTTLMQFVRAMLYGFSADRRARYLPPVHGGRAGGSVNLASADGTFLVARTATDATAPERLEITAGEERLRDDHVLARLLGHVDEAVYRNIFAIGLREIQELGSLSDTDASQWLYKLATGTDRVSLVDVLSELTKARTRLLADGQTSSTIPQLLAEREELRRQATAQSSIRAYLDLGRKRGELRAMFDGWESEATQAERSARLVEIAAAVFDKWHARHAVERDLEAAERIPRLDQQTVDAYDALAASFARAKRRYRILSRKLAKTKQEVTALGFDVILSRRAGRVESLLEQEQWITALDAERVALAERVVALETRRAELCAQLGFDPAGAAGTPAETHGKAWRQLRELASELRAARDRLAVATEEAGSKQKESQTASQQLTAALKARNAESLTPLLESAGQLVSQLRRRVQLDDRVAELTEQQTDVGEQSRDLLSKLLLPGWAVAGLGGGFVLGTMASLGGLFLPASLVGDGRLALVALGLVSSGGSAAAKYALEKTFASRSSRCLAQLESLADQIQKAKQDRDALDQQLPRGGGPLLARLAAAEKEQAAIEALVPLESKRQSNAQDSGDAEQRREEAHAIYTELRHRWRHALIDAGLPPKTPPGRAGQLARVRKHLAKLDARLTEERGELARRQSVVDAFANRLAQLRAELDMLPEDRVAEPPMVKPAAPAPVAKTVPAAVKALPSGIPAELRLLRERLHEQAALASRRKALIHTGNTLIARRKKVRTHGHHLHRKMQSLLKREGVADAAELRARVANSVHSDQLNAQLATFAVEIAALLGPQTLETDIAALVTTKSRQDLDNAWIDHSAKARDLRDRVKTAHEQLGRWQQESQTLVSGRQASQTRVRLGAVEHQLREAAVRWQVLATTESLLAGIRKRYERDRQPETLREASGYLERMTAGRYKRVWTPLDEHVLRVDDAQGNSLSVEVLSRGTREQLFLSLRLALVRWYARRGIELPLVLDDVLVNFDAQRARAAAEVLRDFAARGHQCLVFTCHEHMYHLFRSLDVDARELPANPRVLAMRGLVAEHDVPRPPVAPLVVPSARPAPAEFIEPTLPTNGHSYEHDVAPPPPPPPPQPPPVPVAIPAPVPPRKKRAHVKFDTVHGPRGPFATALWHERVTYELSAEAPEEPPHDAYDDDDWIDVDSVE